MNDTHTCHGMTAAGKILGLGRNVLFDLLREPRCTLGRIKLRYSGFQKAIKSLGEKHRKILEFDMNWDNERSRTMTNKSHM